MFSFDQLHTVQIEITNRCQASCPMCLRNIHGGIENPSLSLNDWTVDQFKNIFNQEVLDQIKCINFCGDFGDPIMNNGIVDMCRYVKEAAPNLKIVINTNGSAHTTQWWKDLADALPEKHTLIFALDGLSDTHSIYRIGTSYEMILRNAQAFIDHGGYAEWVFIRFKHNEHQVEEARRISREMGFKDFFTKDSKRFGKQFPVLNRQGSIEYYIEPPTNNTVKPVEFIHLKDYKQWQNDVSCFTLDSKELYIDANGYLLPCCLIGSFLYANYDVTLYQKYGVIDETSITSIAREVQLEVLDIIKELGGFSALDSNQHSIKDIMNTDVWQSLMHTKWKEKSSSACKILCGKSGPFIKISDQLNRAS